VFLLYAMRRVDCRRCKAVAIEDVPWGNGKHQLTNAYMLFLGAPVFVERNGRRDPHFKVFDAVEGRHVGLEHRTLSQIDAIGVDEIQYSKGQKYLTLVYQIDLGVSFEIVTWGRNFPGAG
jgi:transposase